MPEPTIPLTPRQTITLLRHQIRQAQADLQENETPENARLLADLYGVYADALAAAPTR